MKGTISALAIVVAIFAGSNAKSIAAPSGGNAGGGGVTMGGGTGFGGMSFGSTAGAGTMGGGANMSSSFRSNSWGGGGFQRGSFGHGYSSYTGSYNQFGGFGAGVYNPGWFPGGVIDYGTPTVVPPVAPTQVYDDDRVRDSEVRRQADARRQKLPTSAFVKNYNFSKKKRSQ